MEECALGSLWEVFCKDEFSSKKHWHKELEFVFIISGKLQICVDDVVRDLDEGELFVISEGAVHYYIDVGQKFQVSIVKLSTELFGGFSKETREYLAGVYKDVLQVGKDGEIGKLFHRMTGVLKVQDKRLQELRIISDILELTVFLQHHEKLIKKRVQYKRNNELELLERMKSYISIHYHEKISLTDMAAYLGFSECYCSKYIKKKTNMNFLEYVNSSRIMGAETLLRTTDHSITEIAYSTGFTSIQSFNRVFKAYCSESPSEYRKRLRDKKQSISDKK